ncbi:Serine acetyltransferase [compost metagenome]
MFRSIRESINVVFEKDPAAKSWLEVLLCYPSLHAMAFHRVAHRLHRMGMPLLPRLISQFSRFVTGIEIHPGATIGRRFFIDHGMGVVIGETAVVGDDVMLYHQVTLGGTGKDTGKRHPTLEDGVVVGAGAKILGNITVGSQARIGSGSVVLRDVPPQATVVGIPGRVVPVKSSEGAEAARETPKAQDPEAEAIKALLERVYRLEEALRDVHPEAVESRSRGDRHAPLPEVEDFIHGSGI